jgi:hypothetical protein
VQLNNPVGGLKAISGANPKNAAIWFEPKHVKGVHYWRSWCVVKAGKAVEVNCQNMIYSRNPGLVRLALPAQPVDATPSSQLIRQHFGTENRFVRL